MAKRIFIYLILALMLPNIALCFTEGMTLTENLTNLVLPAGLLMLLASVSRNAGKTVWLMFPLIFFAAFQLVLLYLFGEGIISVDMFLNVVTTNTGEIEELLGNLVPAVAGVFVVYIPLLVVASVAMRRGALLPPAFRHKAVRLGCAATAAGTVLLAVCYATAGGYRILTRLYPANVCYNLALAIGRSAVSANYASASAAFTFHARSTHPADSTEVYVLVIGETARARNFSLYGYSRNTNPLLSRTPHLTVFTDVTSQSNTTHKSVPMLLTAATADDFSRLYHEKGILAAFREAGFHTTFISNQLPNHSFIDFLGMQADDCIFLKKEGDEHRDISDLQLVRKLDEVLARRRKKEFVVLHTYGSHFNYRERYPRRTAVFLPDDKTDAKYENRAELRNAYDNSIVFTDRVLHDIISSLKRRGAQAAMLYTSDHGENLFDDSRRLFLHASPRASIYELHVPFLLWLSDTYITAYPDNAAAVSANRRKRAESSVTTFHTILQLAGIDTPYADRSLSVADTSYAARQRKYINDHNEPQPLPY